MSSLGILLCVSEIARSEVGGGRGTSCGKAMKHAWQSIHHQPLTPLKSQQPFMGEPHGICRRVCRMQDMPCTNRRVAISFGNRPTRATSRASKQRLRSTIESKRETSCDGRRQKQLSREESMVPRRRPCTSATTSARRGKGGTRAHKKRNSRTKFRNRGTRCTGPHTPLAAQLRKGSNIPRTGSTRGP